MVGATDDPGEGLAHGVEVVHHGSLFRREVVEMHHFRAVVKELTVQKAEEIYLDTSTYNKEDLQKVPKQISRHAKNHSGELVALSWFTPNDCLAKLCY